MARCLSGYVPLPSTGPTSTSCTRSRPSHACSSGCDGPGCRRVGCDVAGVVETVGAGVTRFRPGRPGCSATCTLMGSARSRNTSAHRRRRSSRSPPAMSFEQAATLPHAAILAVQGLRLRDGRTAKPGDRVLIDGAAGNVGPFAIQIAMALGAEVTGVDGTAKLDVMRSLGADHVIDYTAGRLHAERRTVRLDPRRGLAPHGPRGSAIPARQRRVRHARRHGWCESCKPSSWGRSSRRRPAGGWA